MPEIVSLIASLVDQLVWIRRSSNDAVARRRANILLCYLRLRSQRTTAWALGHARSTVQVALEELRLRGVNGLSDGRRRHQPSFDRGAVLKLLRELAASSPRDHGWARTTWTAELFAIELRKQAHVTLSRPTVSRLLREAGCRRRVPVQCIRRAPADKAERMHALATDLCATGPDDVILCADEVDIHLNPKVGPDWMPPGLRKSVVTPGQNQKAYVAGAYDPLNGDLIAVSGFSKRSTLFIELVHAVVERLPNAPTIHLVVDNYVIHRSKVTQRALAKLGDKVQLHFLPPYCPDCNPIERVWWDLHAAVTRNHQCQNIGELLDEVEAFISTRDQFGQRAASLRRAS